VRENQAEGEKWCVFVAKLLACLVPMVGFGWVHGFSSLSVVLLCPQDVPQEGFR
jgi:hypothetical protein